MGILSDAGLYDMEPYCGPEDAAHNIATYVGEKAHKKHMSGLDIIRTWRDRDPYEKIYIASSLFLLCCNGFYLYKALGIWKQMLDIGVVYRYGSAQHIHMQHLTDLFYDAVRNYGNCVSAFAGINIATMFGDQIDRIIDKK